MNKKYKPKKKANLSDIMEKTRALLDVEKTTPKDAHILANYILNITYFRSSAKDKLSYDEYIENFAQTCKSVGAIEIEE